MLSIGQIFSDIQLARREIKNIRQESLKQKANLNLELTKIKSLISEKEDHNKIIKYEEKEKIDERFLMIPIGHIKSCFNHKNGIPRQPSLCPTAKGTLTIQKSVFTNPEHSLIGLEEFSHIWILFLFHENGDRSNVKAKIHPPRLNGASVGVFSTRSPHRPSAIGLSLIKLDRIEGSTLHLSGLDLLNGTPVLDIKPYIPAYDVPYVPQSNVLGQLDSDRPDLKNECEGSSHANNVEEVATEDSTTLSKQINNDHCNVATYLKNLPGHLNVTFTNRALDDLVLITAKDNCVYSYSEAKEVISEVLRNDPRSVYRKQKCSDRLYYFSINILHVTCWFDDNIAEVLRVKFEYEVIQ
ncbi:hypothetical protein JTE90_027569 [Oedothorax gibbosus]|uniref:TsaA-like domain-containing protein n=1 Tax=Oedothorax gibbosus TaxID=931172 RepID=A0AAV6VJ76_9ARAC|nr:hypothetical protein JTE90_027569 [Oedothorax gibbosus]